MELLTTRYSENLVGVLSCYDRIVITGTLPGACFADGMTSFLYSRGIRIFDYPQFALPLRERIRVNAATLAAEHGVTIEHIAKAHIRKEDVVAKVLAARGDAPGLVHVISACSPASRIQHPRTGALRPHTTAARSLALQAVAPTASAACAGPDQARRQHLPLLPYSRRPPCYRCVRTPHHLRDRSRTGQCMIQSPSFSLKSA